jgi:aminopeptidase N
MSASDLFGDIRLGTRVIPSKYDVSITPALEAPFVFSGKVIITLELKEGAQPLKAIVCHALELEIEAADVALTREGADGKGVSHACTEVVFDVKTEQVAFLFGEGADLSAGAATLEIHNYKGVHNDKLAGFYRSKYTDSENKEKHTVVTQFEATDARRGLPCWDEPAFKAVFSVELTVPGHLWAISNMPEQSRLAVGHDKIKIRYYPSPIMSSYLLAFIVGEFDMIAGVVPATHTDTHQYNPCDIRVFTPVGKSDQGHFALDVAKKCLAFFNEFFQSPFPLPKLDLIAIADFAAGAMENWGAVGV